MLLRGLTQASDFDRVENITRRGLADYSRYAQNRSEVRSKGNTMNNSIFYIIGVIVVIVVILKLVGLW